MSIITVLCIRSLGFIYLRVACMRDLPSLSSHHPRSRSQGMYGDLCSHYLLFKWIMIICMIQNTCVYIDNKINKEKYWKHTHTSSYSGYPTLGPQYLAHFKKKRVYFKAWLVTTEQLKSMKTPGAKSLVEVKCKAYCRSWWKNEWCSSHSQSWSVTACLWGSLISA